jgi:hypothetical protein
VTITLSLSLSLEKEGKGRRGTFRLTSFLPLRSETEEGQTEERGSHISHLESL